MKKATPAILLAFSFLLCSAQPDQSGRGLKDYYSSYFPVGVAVAPWDLKNPAESSFILQQFNSLTPENCMKMGPIHPKENEYNWKDADSILAFAQKNHLRIRGHNLCWHQQIPEWFFKDANGNEVTKEVLLQRLKEHISTVMKRYKGKIYAWDVVNEAISDKPDEYLRNSLWYKICGEDYIAQAFRFAHEADPDAILFYNDYNEISPVKRKKMIRLLNSLIDAGVPVNAVGLQGHWAINEPSAAKLDSTLADFSKLGLQIQVTELDISVYPKEHIARERKPEDSSTDYTPEKEAMQTTVYKYCFALFRKYKKYITGVTCWNVSDKNSWLDNFPVKGRKDYPLLFDKNLQPKKAYWAIVE